MTEDTLPIEEAVANNMATGLISGELFLLDKNTPSDDGVDYKPLYYGLFNGITTILRNATTTSKL